jgi:ribosome recycling factor
MSDMVDLIFEEMKDRVNEVRENLKKHLGKVRTGRASVSMLDEVKANYYGQMTPLKGMANITVPEPRQLVIQPFDPSVLKDIEKAIIGSDLGLNPHNDGKVLRVVIPELTEERRKDLVKVVKKIAEEHRVSARQVRRDSNEELKKAEKDKEITEDELHKSMDKVQKDIDHIIAEIDKISEGKINELMEIK